MSHAAPSVLMYKVSSTRIASSSDRGLTVHIHDTEIKTQMRTVNPMKVDGFSYYNVLITPMLSCCDGFRNKSVVKKETVFLEI